jgi:hypothetical protein
MLLKQLLSFSLDADRAPQLKASVRRLTSMPVKEVSNAEAATLRRMLKLCPACQRGLEDHRYTLLGMTVASRENEQRLGEFSNALKTQDWSKAKEFSEFDGGYNALEAYALKGVSGSFVFLVVRDPFELFESSSILHSEVLNRESGADLERVLGGENWRSL